MKKKLLTATVLLVPLIFIIGSIQAGTIPTLKKESLTLQTIHVSQQFSVPELLDTTDGTIVHLNESTGYRNIPGEPILPQIVRTYEFPFGTHITDIRCTISDTTELQLVNPIVPAVKPVPWVNENIMIQPIKNTAIYSSNQLFPDTWYSTRLTGGLNKDNLLTTFLTIQLNPVRYTPNQNTIEVTTALTLDITYEEPIRSFAPTTDAYDLVIICYDKYASLLDPLVTHKTSHGIQTKLVPLKDIYDSTYFPVEGRDNQEQIKYFIKNAKENWNITYVMLVGDYKKVPARYTNLETDAGSTYEELRFVTDLYYADLYDSEGNFSSWDTDEDGIYGEWPYPEGHAREDIVDLAPDVHVGRLACMFSFEVKTLVNKIIDYEENAAGSDWFNNMVVIGGDTFDKSWEGGTDYNEGEEATAYALEFMPEFTPIKIWTTLENLTTKNMHNEISKGCGFLYFCGHGNPQMWSTHINGDYHNWTEGFNNMNMLRLTNKGMYPILMVGGCHNSEFDATPMNFITGLLSEKLQYFSKDPESFGSFYKYNWVPECWSWVFIKVAHGGAIASMGSIGYGGVSIGDYNHNGIPDCVEGSDGWFETQFFRLYNEEHIDILGQTYSQDLTNYVNSFPVDTNRYDAKIVETHALFGDPSLKIGGYE